MVLSSKDLSLENGREFASKGAVTLPTVNFLLIISEIVVEIIVFLCVLGMFEKNLYFVICSNCSILNKPNVFPSVVILVAGIRFPLLSNL